MKKQNKAISLPKKAKKVKGETLVNFILDKSGSMESVRAATISGFNEYIKTLKKDGNKYSFSLTLFDTLITTPYLNQDLGDVKELNNESYSPDGMTALYDAVCQTIKGITEKKDQKVINIIMTDGEENSSKEYTQVQMKSLIEERTKKGNWTFVYLGANQDSYVNAQKFGISQMNASNFTATAKGMANAMNTVASNTCNFAIDSNTQSDAFFSKADQTNLEADKDGDKISQHFSNLGKKSWQKRKKDLLN